MIEIRRTETSKTFDLGKDAKGRQRYALETYTGPIHYKDNYQDETELWKDIDLTIRDGKITQAPYILTIVGKKLNFKNKKTGDVSTLELISSSPTGLNWKIVPGLNGVTFQHILPSDKVPFEAQFKVTGKAPITRAFDDEGELELETSLVDGILTEKLSQVKDRETGQVRPAKGSIRIDPTYQTAASLDDVHELESTGAISNLSYGVANQSSADITFRYWGGYRWTGMNIPLGSTIDSVTFEGYVYADDYDNANFNMHFELAAAPAQFTTTASDITGRTRTTASVSWVANSLGGATFAAQWVTSPSLVTPLQEVVDSYTATALVIITRPNTNSLKYVYFRPYDSGDNTLGAKLTVTWTEAGAFIPKIFM